MEIYAEILSGHSLKGGQWNELNFGMRNFFIGSTFVPNFSVDFFCWFGMDWQISNFTVDRDHS